MTDAAQSDARRSGQRRSRTVARAVVLVAIGVALAPVTSFPVGGANINPTQHLVNVVAAVLLGPWQATGIALVIGVIRNALGVGTLLAFPGGMIGALLAGYAWRLTHRDAVAAAGELVGTAVLGAILGGLLVAPVFMDQPAAALAFVPSFFGSSLVGVIIGVAALRVLRRTDLA